MASVQEDLNQESLQKETKNKLRIKRKLMLVKFLKCLNINGIKKQLLRKIIKTLGYNLIYRQI